MGTRGRKSRTELSVVGNDDNAHAGSDVDASRPPPAPAQMHAQAQRRWQEIVAAYPADRFDQGQLDLLKQYCRHAVRADWLDAQINDYVDPPPPENDAEPAPEFDQSHFNSLLAKAEAETRALASLAVRLGFAHSTAYNKRKPPKGGRGGAPKLWDEA